MARTEPSEASGYIFLNALLLFLMLIYNMPLAIVYSFMVLLDALAYIFGLGVVSFIPCAKQGEGKLMKYITGIAFGIGFLYIYNYMSKMPMAAVFATTAFGDSKIMTVLVFSFLVAPVETRLFFRTLMQWGAYLAGYSSRSSPFSAAGLFLMAFFGAAFVLFHLTAKGITAHAELLATFVFGALSVGMILYFQEWIQAGIAHVVINSKAMGLFETLPQLMQYWYSWAIVGAVGYFVYRAAKRKGTSIFSI